MKRLAIAPRNDWQARLEGLGFSFHSMDGLYWREGACYEFGSAEIDYLEEVTATLYGLCLEAVEHVVSNNLFARLKIPFAFEELIRRSWRRRDPSLYGRFDFAYNGRGDAKLLEFNADTPTALFESSIVQWAWLEDLFPNFDQFNSIHEKLLAAFTALKAKLPPGAPFHFSCVQDHEEDLVTVEYLRDVAVQAGIDGHHLFIEDIGYSAETGRFADLDRRGIDFLFKLYPWEWLIADEFGGHLLAEPISLILEPAWKMVLSNKGILPLLWEMYPGHPNLLPAAFEPLAGRGKYVKKPLFSREGANIGIFERHQAIEETDGSYGSEGAIFQEYCELPRFGEQYALIGSWVVHDKPAGIGIREDDTPITRNSSTFVPHLFKP